VPSAAQLLSSTAKLMKPFSVTPLSIFLQPIENKFIIFHRQLPRNRVFYPANAIIKSK
jgi:hypothetical protein